MCTLTMLLRMIGVSITSMNELSAGRLRGAQSSTGFGGIPPGDYAVFWSVDRYGTRLTTVAEHDGR